MKNKIQNSMCRLEPLGKSSPVAGRGFSISHSPLRFAPAIPARRLVDSRVA